MGMPAPTPDVTGPSWARGHQPAAEITTRVGPVMQACASPPPGCTMYWSQSPSERTFWEKAVRRELGVGRGPSLQSVGNQTSLFKCDGVPPVRVPPPTLLEVSDFDPHSCGGEQMALLSSEQA